VWYDYYKREGSRLLNDPKSPPLSYKKSKQKEVFEKINAYADDW